MSEPRLKTGIFVSAALRRADLAGSPGMVLRRGDADAGGILVILRNRSNLCTVLTQARKGDGAAAWMRATGAEPVPEPEAQAYIDRQVKRDPDVWVVEFETDSMTPPFEANYI